LIILIFAYLMPKRTLLGQDILRQIFGFKLYLKTAEKYRAQFNEKENIFDKFLPYAILFGMTNLWLKKMKDMYGDQYFATHPMVWYIAAPGHTFDYNFSSINTMINSVSSSVASGLKSAGSSSGGFSGFGGGGFSGGGGGGGGGGSW
jgi:uncharacterized membrane protein